MKKHFLRFKKHFFKIGAGVLALVFCAFMLTSCVSERSDVIFSTYYQLSVWGGGAASAEDNISRRLQELEARLSPNIATAEIAKINNADKNVPILVSEDTIFLLKQAKIMYQKTNGAYNPAIFPIVELWGFDPKNFDQQKTRVPRQEEIDATLPLCKLENFVLDEVAKTITKTEAGAKLDFGASAKGYAADESRLLLPNNPDFLINIGGNVLVGAKSKTIGIQSPFGKDVYKVLKLERCGASTAGSYERNFVANGTEYHHIIGKNGYPSGIELKNPPVSVSIVAGASVVSDMLSTVGMLLSAEEFDTVLKSYNASAMIIYRDASAKMLNNFELYIKE